ncbi:MAG: dTDP-4-dehydrorhamnose reductase [Fluviicoccus sp.]|uniref:dTDP-4-dehydrorhamnose reductase n=1 Tax=Fluviicoccus sp. TaxID=2003552 RepID=UPI002723F2EF|nr:dTDP-4-dehydrorhamnose reductase [Fluviicoccus sp.]MDO8331650.1 dTDP-4-dehydrorhamnose reductase [Fluviicoccus sp.]
MTILVTGANGQVGWELVRSLQPLGRVVGLGRQGCDLSRPESLNAVLASVKPSVIVNAAAYTAVDKAEQEQALADTVNGESVGVLAEWARRHQAIMVHYSTDYVFDGAKDSPYVETDAVAPLNAYGRSKLKGEQALAAVGPDYLCLRTTWVYAARGQNFMNTMLRLGRERPELRVVADQTGAPTWARHLADATALMLQARRDGRGGRGIYHLTGSGAMSWCGFAELILARARELGLTVQAERVVPISSAEFPTPARRPANSRLDNARIARDFGIVLPDAAVSLSLALT